MIYAQEIAKSFGSEQILHQISFDLEEQSTLSVLGKSGCGKTTLLKVLSGLEQADHGIFRANDTDLFALPSQHRGVVYLSQYPLLFPHLTVFENIAFGLRIRKMEKDSIQEQVTTMLAQLGLAAQAQKKPEQLSGGQKQRVAFGRAIIIRPKVLLLDEPFGSLDAHTREEMQRLFLTLRKAYKMTALFVTHDLKEALLMGHKMGYMEAGKLTVFHSVEEFAQSPVSGVKKETAFWRRFL